MTGLKSLCWKELRENFKWAAIAFVIVISAMFYALRISERPEWYELCDSVCSKSFLLVIDYGLALVGLLLGFVQVLTELRRDQWAFLVHRPITRNMLFFGKMVPGVLLYLFATLLPLLIVGWWISMPGVRPYPFDWRMMLPGVVDVFVGMGFYFAALWAGMSGGPWYGRRILPLIGAIIIADSAWLREEGCTVLMTTLLLWLAAWGVFQSFGVFNKQKVWSKAAMVLILLKAIGVLYFLILFVWSWAGSAPSSMYTNYTDYRISKEGELVKVTRKISKNSQDIQRVETMDGKVLSPPNGRATFGFDDFLQNPYLWFPGRDIYSLSKNRNLLTRQARIFYEGLSDFDSGELWYYVKKDRMFNGYSKENYRLFGHIGSNGFVEEGTGNQVKNFEGVVSRGYWYTPTDPMVCADALYKIDTKKRDGAVKLLIRQAMDNPISSAAYFMSGNEQRDSEHDYLALARNGFIAFSADGKINWTLPLPEKINKYDGVNLFRTEDKSRMFLIFVSRNSTEDGRLFIELDANGKVVRQFELPKDEKLVEPVSVEVFIKAMLQPFGQTCWQQLTTLVNQTLDGKDFVPVWKYQENRMRMLLLYYVMPFVMGIVCVFVGLTYIGRLRMSTVEKNCWLLFILFFSFAGLLVLWIVNDWPLRLACGKCGRKRSVEDANCEHCGVTWPLASKDGTEIFEKESV